jgi:hypothetical protein
MANLTIDKHEGNLAKSGIGYVFSKMKDQIRMMVIYHQYRSNKSKRGAQW